MLSSDRPQTFVELLRSKSLRHPDRLAYTFLVDGEHEEQQLTFGELDRQARAIAAHLQELQLKGQRVLLLYAPGLDYIVAFLGCLYAGVIAIPAYPPRNNQSLLRLQMIQEDAQAAATLSTSLIRTRAELLFEKVPALQILAWIMTDTLDSRWAETWTPPEIDGQGLAFLQYTSGSTALPKGVMVSHGNLLHNEQCIQELFQQTEHSIIVGWLPLYHDMGLIGNVLQPLYVGAACVLMSPVAFLQRPFRWLQAISNYQGTTSGGPNFAYELCHNRITAEQRATLDLSSWRVAFNGAEPIRHETLDRFATTFAECGFRRESFYPCYGLAESTLVVSGKLSGEGPSVKCFEAAALENNGVVECDTEHTSSRSLVSCGASLHTRRIIVDPQTLTESLPGQVGEIWVKGESVAQGYWNRPEETEHTFHAYLSDTKAGPFLRTGDLGFLHEGELFITGRAKDLIIIRGQNHCPQDIEFTVERCHRAFGPGGGAAFSIELGGEERLVVVQEFDQRSKADVHEAINQIRQVISDEHELHTHAVVLIKRGTILKTSSGKIQRSACRAAFLNDALETLAEWRSSAHSSVHEESDTPSFDSDAKDSSLSDAKAIETWLRTEVAQKLGVGSDRLDVTEPLTRLGLDSLMAIELSYAVEQRLGVALPMTSFMQDQSLAQLSLQAAELLADSSSRRSFVTVIPETVEAGLRSGTEVSLSPVRSVSTEPDLPLSFGQRRLWLLQQLQPDSSFYNLGITLSLSGQLNQQALVQSLEEIIRRHEALRSGFPVREGQPRHHISHELRANLRVIDLRGAPEDPQQSEQSAIALAQEEARQPFDLANAPLWRTLLLRLDDDRHLLLLCLHHIICDGWSISILVRELATLYEAFSGGRPSPLPALTVQYRDYAMWQQQHLTDDALAEQLAYWREQMAGAPVVLELPTDRVRPAVQNYRGATINFGVERELTERLEGLSRNEGVTLFMTLLAAFNVLLQRYSHQEDLVVGTPIAGRNRAEGEPLIGFFVNTLALRTQTSGNPAFVELLERVKEVTLGAYAHQQMPFEKLVEELRPAREMSHAPLFQVMLVFQRGVHEHVRLGNVDAQLRLVDVGAAKFDLTLMLQQLDRGALAGQLEYNTDLFEATTIERMTGHFQRLLEAVVTDPLQRISALPLLGEDERQELLTGFNQAVQVESKARCINELFEAQVKRTPEVVALIAGEQSLTYAELNRRACALASYLQSKGVGAESVVGVLMRRSPEMLISLLGILKAGGAYVPLDANYPEERLRLMLADADVRIVLTQEDRLDVVKGLWSDAPKGCEAVCVDRDWPFIVAHDGGQPDSIATPDNAAYVIYTSGSTGIPKGVVIQHSSACSFLFWAARTFSAEQLQGTLASTSINFDLSIFELFLPLSLGATIILADSALQLPELPEANRVTIVNTVPSAMAELLRIGGVPGSVRTVNLAGEALHYSLVERLYALAHIREVYNLYGPSEDTTYSTFALMKRDGKGAAPIGRPIANTQAYVLDEGGELVPRGVWGELYLSGEGLARGYLNRPAETAERFVPESLSGRAGARMYRTGDVVRYGEGGELEYQGRKDYQVKVRGFRIELGEVETVLGEQAGVRESVVVVRQDAAGNQRLVAYVVQEREGSANGEGDGLAWRSELRRKLKERLPEYMVPGGFVKLESLPRTMNGKVDRARLPEVGDVAREVATKYEEAGTELERVIAGVWREVLGITAVGVNDNFFDLGGHSLLLAQAHGQLSGRLNRRFVLLEMFKYPTIRTLASYLGQKNGAPATPRPDKELIENLNEGQIRRAKLFKRRSGLSV